MTWSEPMIKRWRSKHEAKRTQSFANVGYLTVAYQTLQIESGSLGRGCVPVYQVDWKTFENFVPGLKERAIAICQIVYHLALRFKSLLWPTKQSWYTVQVWLVGIAKCFLCQSKLIRESSRKHIKNSQSGWANGNTMELHSLGWIPVWLHFCECPRERLSSKKMQFPCLS